MTTVVLFNTLEVKRSMLSGGTILMANPENGKKYRLGQAITIIGNNAEEFDRCCQVNIGWIGPQFLSRISDITNEIDEAKLNVIVSMAYRFLLELDMSMKNELSSELQSFMKMVESDGEMSGDALEEIQYARQRMPVAILKRLLNSDELGSLTNVAAVAANVEEKLVKWQSDLGASEQKVTQLSTTLKTQEHAFNFVALHKGFADLGKDITKELRYAQFSMLSFGLLTLLPSSGDLWLVLIREMDLSKTPSYTLIAALISTVTITLLFLYFFRIALRKADSCRAQLVQVRLRMSLCRFIQSYADFSAEIKVKNSDALAKFEALIFSGIVGTEDKLPSTFDGIEQLSGLAKSLRKNGKK
jgi:hypothetical protein